MSADNDKKLQDELRRYQAAIKQEYESACSSDQEQVEEYTRDYFKRNINMAAAQIVWLSEHAESESARLSASKYVIEAALKQSEKDADPIKSLLSEITSKAQTSTP